MGKGSEHASGFPVALDFQRLRVSRCLAIGYIHTRASRFFGRLVNVGKVSGVDGGIGDDSPVHSSALHSC